MLKFLKKSSRVVKHRLQSPDITKLRGRLLITYHSFSPKKQEDRIKISSKYYDEYMILKREMFELQELIDDYEQQDIKLQRIEQTNRELRQQAHVLAQIMDDLAKHLKSLEEEFQNEAHEEKVHFEDLKVDVLKSGRLQAQIQVNQTLIQKINQKLQTEQEQSEKLQQELKLLQQGSKQKDNVKRELEQQQVKDQQELNIIQNRLDRYLYECKILLEQKFCVRRETRNFYVQSPNDQYQIKRSQRKIIKEQVRDDQMTTQKKQFPQKPKIDQLNVDFIFKDVQSLVQFLDIFNIGSLFRNINLFHEQCRYLLSSDYECLYGTKINPKVQFSKCFDGKDSNPALITLLSDNSNILHHIVPCLVNLKNFSNQFVTVKEFKFKCYQFQIQNHTPIHQYTLHDHQQIQKYLKNEDQHLFQKTHYMLQFRYQVNDLSFRRINILALASDLIIDIEIFSDFFRRSYKKVKFEQTPHFGAFIDQIVRVIFMNIQQSSKQVVITQINRSNENIFKLSQGLIIRN